MPGLGWRNLEKKPQSEDQRKVFDKFAQILKGCHLYIKMMFQFFRLDFLHNFNVK
jgi:hypothetical protein